MALRGRFKRNFEAIGEKRRDSASYPRNFEAIGEKRNLRATIFNIHTFREAIEYCELTNAG